MIDTEQNTSPVAPAEDKLKGFRASVRGETLVAGDAGYDEARKVWNGMIDNRPALIARCADVADVIAAVNFAREQGLPVAIRGGSHNVTGNAVCDERGRHRPVAHEGHPSETPRSAPSARRAGAPGATWTTPRTPLGSRRPAGSSPPPVSPGSRWAAASATSRASTASPATT